MNREDIYPEGSSNKSLNKEYRNIENHYGKTNDLSSTLELYRSWKEKFSVHARWPCYEFFVDFLIEIDQPELALKEWNTLQDEERSGMNMNYTYRNWSVKRLIDFDFILKEPVITGKNIFHIAPKGNQLTSFGKRNMPDVFRSLEVMLKESFSFGFFEGFFIDYDTNRSQILNPHPFDFYERFFYDKKSKKSWDYFIDYRERLFKGDWDYRYNDEFFKKDGSCKFDFVHTAMQYEAKRLLREAENNYRVSIGAKKIGEAWISETELFYKIKKRLSKYKVIQHGRPDWLGRQHLDIWIPELMVAVEYQGAQHDRPIEFFGGQDAHKKGKKRDARKVEKCIEAGVRLIEVRPNYDIDKVIIEIQGI